MLGCTEILARRMPTGPARQIRRNSARQHLRRGVPRLGGFGAPRLAAVPWITPCLAAPERTSQQRQVTEVARRGTRLARSLDQRLPCLARLSPRYRHDEMVPRCAPTTRSFAPLAQSPPRVL